MQKKRFIKILFLVIVFWMLFINLKSYGATVISQDGKWEYYVKSNEIYLSSYLGTDTSVEIPRILDGYEVKHLNSFLGNKLIEHVKIPSTIENMGYLISGAFAGCENLKTVEIEEGKLKSIGILEFSGCTQLTNIKIPSNIESISDYAFINCKNLEIFDISSGIKTIGVSAFSGCEKLTTINIDSQNKNFSYQDGVLYDYNKTKIVFYPLTKKDIEYSVPDSVKELKIYNIENNYLEKINIHSGVSKINSNALSLCSSLKQIKVNEENLAYADIDGVLFNKSKSDLICYPSGKKESLYVVPNTVDTIIKFSGNDNLKELVIRNTVTNIEEDAFEECDNLVIYCNSGSYAEKYAKENNILYQIVEGVITDKYIYEINEDNSSCTIIDYIGNETQVIIPEKIDSYNVTKIGSKAFYANENINYIEIHKDIKEIGIKAFSGCINLKNISVDTQNLNYISDDGILFNKNKTELICFPPEKEVVNNNYPIPDTVTEIAYGAFEGNEKLRCINFGANVANIGNQAFSQCKQLEEINVSMNSIYESENGVLFKNKKSDLICYPSGKKDKKYEIPIAITTIVDFIDNDYIEEVIFNQNVEFVDISAFQHCENLKNIDMSKSKIETIKNSTFYNCKALENIKFPKSLRAIYDYAFAECNSLKEVILPDAVEYIGIGAFSNCNSLVNVDLNNVTRIGDEAFKKCTSLKEIVISDKVKNILSQAFSECTNLEKVTILSKDIKIAKDTFLNCNDITIHCYKGSTVESFAIENNKDYKLIDNVIEEKLSVTLKEESKYKIETQGSNLYIINISPKTTIETALTNINTNGEIRIYKGSQEITDKTKNIATGMTIKVTKGTETKEYIVIVSGDATGDGEINAVDLIAAVKQYKYTKTNGQKGEKLEGAKLKAIKFTEDSKYTAADLIGEVKMFKEYTKKQN